MDMKKEIPFRDSSPQSLVSVRVTPEIKKQLSELKGMGVDVGKLMRLYIEDAIKDAFKALDAKVS